jgi:hypothetical protein
MTNETPDQLSEAELHFVFDKFPCPEGSVFIECENEHGQSVNSGLWRERPDGYVELVLALARPLPEGGERDATILPPGLDLPAPQAAKDSLARGVAMLFPEAVANARLIAAAPELLAALKEAVEDLEQTLRWSEGWECSEDDLLGNARAAIAKATTP